MKLRSLSKFERYWRRKDIPGAIFCVVTAPAWIPAGAAIYVGVHVFYALDWIAKKVGVA